MRNCYVATDIPFGRYLQATRRLFGSYSLFDNVDPFTLSFMEDELPNLLAIISLEVWTCKNINTFVSGARFIASCSSASRLLVSAPAFKSSSAASPWPSAMACKSVSDRSSWQKTRNLGQVTVVQCRVTSTVRGIHWTLILEKQFYHWYRSHGSRTVER